MNWIKRIFTAKRIVNSIKFSLVIGVTVWASQLYEKALSSQNPAFYYALVFLLVAGIILIFGGKIVELF